MQATLSPASFSATTPLSVGSVGLNVGDLDRVAGYYRDVIGLAEIDRHDGRVRLGAGGVPLIELIHRPDHRPEDPRSAGLFHTAFLLPSRADLAAWLRHVAVTRVRLDGASDHLVSEAIYLTDPEGNGIEVYRDRPQRDWPHEMGKLRMASDPLDLQALLDEAPEAPAFRAPERTIVGHVHLRVGDTEAANRFYGGVLGLDVMAAYPGASFLASGGYHHHVGANVWHSRGAGRRPADRLGLAHVTFLADARSPISPANAPKEDPWGISIRVEAK